jgi:hypothetical protein
MSCHVVAGAAHTVIVVETEMGDIFGGFSGIKIYCPSSQNYLINIPVMVCS